MLADRLQQPLGAIDSFPKLLGFVGYENDKVKQLMEELQLTTFCGEVEGGGLTPEDPTCLAFWAGLKAHLELQESYEPVSFHYETWLLGSGRGCQVAVGDGSPLV